MADEFDMLTESQYWSWVDRAKFLIEHGYVDIQTDPFQLARKMYHKRNRVE